MSTKHFPITAYKALITRGMEAHWRRVDGSLTDPVLVTGDATECDDKFWTENSYGGHCYADVQHDDAQGVVDLYNPHTWDRCLRALYAHCRRRVLDRGARLGGLPEHPLYLGFSEGQIRKWKLNRFVFGAGHSVDPYFFEVPAAERVPRDRMDKDVCALAVVLEAMLGGAK